MNWQKTRDGNPKAWLAFCDWARMEYVGMQSITKDPEVFSADCLLVYGEAFNTRDLYDFFDSKGLYCSVAYDHSTGSWLWDITSRGNQVLWTESGDERGLSESAAFTRAFQILEERLAA